MVRSFFTKFSTKSESKLLALCKNNPDKDRDVEKWNRAAIQFLVRKLRKDSDLIEELHKAILHKLQKTKCIPVSKIPDNRLLVSHRRGLPQVIYCRLWRWPDLQSHHQIRAISTCESSAEFVSSGPSVARVELPSRSNTVCVNPYHYERAEPQPIEPILVRCSKIPPDLSTSFEDSDTTGTKARPFNPINSTSARTTTISRNLARTISAQVVASGAQETQVNDNIGTVLNAAATTTTTTDATNETIRSILYAQETSQNTEPMQSLTQLISDQAPVDLIPSGTQPFDSINMDNGVTPREIKTENCPDDAQSSQNGLLVFDRDHNESFSTPRPEEFDQETYDFLERILPEAETQSGDGDINEIIDRYRPKSKSFNPDDKTATGADNSDSNKPALEPNDQEQHQHQATPQQVTNQQAIQTHQQHPNYQQQYQQSQQQQQYHQSTQQQQQQYQQRYQQYPQSYQQQQSAAQYYQLPQRQPLQIQQQYQQQLNQTTQYSQQQHQPQGTLLGQSVNPIEFTRPYLFKQNRFTNVACTPVSCRPQGYEQQGYMSAPFANVYDQPQQPSPRQATHVQFSRAQQYQPQQQCAPSASYSQHSQCVQNPSITTYTTLTSHQLQQHQRQQQQNYPQQEQMQLDNEQPSVPMTVVAQQGTYYEPMAGPSHTVDQPMDQIPMIDIQEVPFTEGTSWCSMSYHEYEVRVGEKYHPNSCIVSIDGYTQPMCSDRFCIGGLSNIKRSQFTEWVRRRIGRGVKLTYVDGEVYVECQCESSVFVSNPLLVQEEGGLFIEQVSKLTQGCSLKVFSTVQFSKLLSESASKGFEAVYKMTNCCIIRISFVKGWGRNYKRQSIFDIPCWVEVQLNGPLLWIDKVLRQMRPPTGCGSTS